MSIATDACDDDRLGDTAGTLVFHFGDWAKPAYVHSQNSAALLETSRAFREQADLRYERMCRGLLSSWFGGAATEYARSLTVLRESVQWNFLCIFRALTMLDSVLDIARVSISMLPSTRALLQQARSAHERPSGSAWDSEEQYAGRIDFIMTRMAVVLAGGAATFLHLLSLKEHAAHLCKPMPGLRAHLHVASLFDVLATGGLLLNKLSEDRGMSFQWCRLRCNEHHSEVVKDTDSLRNYALRERASFFCESLPWHCQALLGMLSAMRDRLHMDVMDLPKDYEQLIYGLALDAVFAGHGTRGRSVYEVTVECRRAHIFLEEVAPIIEWFDVDVSACGAVKDPYGVGALHLFKNVSEDVLLGSKMRVSRRDPECLDHKRIREYERWGWTDAREACAGNETATASVPYKPARQAYGRGRVSPQLGVVDNTWEL